jgi:hypothetical protein
MSQAFQDARTLRGTVWIFTAPNPNVLAVYILIMAELCFVTEENCIEQVNSIFLDECPKQPAILKEFCFVRLFQYVESMNMIW